MSRNISKRIELNDLEAKTLKMKDACFHPGNIFIPNVRVQPILYEGTDL